MNDTIQILLQHRSIREFKERPLTREELQTIIQSAQAAPSSSFVQAYSIIGIRDPQKKEQLAELAGNQPYVAQNGHLLVFCLDLHRLSLAAELEGVSVEKTLTALQSVETFMVGVIDAALAAQNAVVAAESQGLGTVYIGGLRNRLPEVVELLKTPERVIPLFALCIGEPAQPSAVKPRLPMAAVYHEEEYTEDQAHTELLQAYNAQMSRYYAERTEGKRAEGWTAGIAKQLKNPKRLYMKEFLGSRKLPLE
ncbi:oxygen-insensitive NADPH nitroreductase [Paenibacillus sp. YN15]|uniref:oxygen-insensitive NADPH nitroreductase n=1 Tax=Paenibacillus sp. YN15 TaxID=1742774 RepID=UPI000DCF6086|nr:oxygen-insensitive NADPH nitroreductase [Paenibacillus sp. YN15]RAU93474.1 oxygen-insensitive NADPH nitroreductase [Paenibacillus sp. YN15]